MESKTSKPSRRGLKKILKPMIEKKRRDRINHRLDELRNILLSNTSDMRLKNPKLEKAEILEMTVEYIKTNGKDCKASAMHMGKSSEPVTGIMSSQTIQSDPPHMQTQTPSSLIYHAGFQECIFRLSTFIESVEPSQRESFVHELRNLLDGHVAPPQNRTSSQSIPVDLQIMKNSTMGHVSSVESSFPYFNNYLSLYPKPFVLHHHYLNQSLPHPYPSPPYSVSPPPSPTYSSISPPFTTTPPYLSIPCHFSFSPSPQLTCEGVSLTPASCSPPALPSLGAPLPSETSPPTPLRYNDTLPNGPTRTLRRSLFQIQSQAVWRPWP